MIVFLYSGESDIGSELVAICFKLQHIQKTNQRYYDKVETANEIESHRKGYGEILFHL